MNTKFYCKERPNLILGLKCISKYEEIYVGKDSTGKRIIIDAIQFRDGVYISEHEFITDLLRNYINRLTINFLGLYEEGTDYEEYIEEIQEEAIEKPKKMTEEQAYREFIKALKL